MVRRLPLVLVLTVGVLSGTMIGCGSSGDETSGEIRIEGLSTEDIVNAGILRKIPAEEPAFDAKHGS